MTSAQEGPMHYYIAGTTNKLFKDGTFIGLIQQSNATREHMTKACAMSFEQGEIRRIDVAVYAQLVGPEFLFFSIAYGPGEPPETVTGG